MLHLDLKCINVGCVETQECLMSPGGEVQPVAGVMEERQHNSGNGNEL